jgi:DNA-binding CsgD family transcriptional regulator
MDVTATGIDAKATALQMRSDGKSLGEIATVLGRHRSTIQSWVRGV